MTKKIFRCLVLSPSSFNLSSLRRKGYLKAEKQHADPNFFWLYKENVSDITDQDELLKQVHLSGFIPVTYFTPFSEKETKPTWSCIVKHSKFNRGNNYYSGLIISKCYSEDFFHISHHSKYELELAIAVKKISMASDIDNF